MILHIFNKQEKFSIQYIKFLKDSGFDLDNQFIFHYGKSSGFFEKQNVNCIFSNFIDIGKHIRLYKKMREAEKVIVHSLASPFLLFLLLFNFKVTKKIYWVVWGKDLYFKKCVNMKNPINIIYEFLRKLSIKNVKHIVTNVDGDYELAKKWYGVDAVFHKAEGVGYPYNSNINPVLGGYKTSLNKVLLGNSASKSNNHIEALYKLKECDNQNMEVISPLSYGGKKKYVQKVICIGKQLFGDRFKPIVDFMPLQKYNAMLDSIDVAFFYHDRQEAFSNLLTLIGQGKKVYIRTESTLWNYFKDKGIIVHDSNNVDDTLFCVDEKEIVENNHNQVLKIGDIELSKRLWKEIFEYNG